MRKQGSRLTKQKFISIAKDIHGDRYEYSESDYKHSRQKLEIICSLHGSFWQSPNHHMAGKGCPACGRLAVNESFSKCRILTAQSFLDESHKVHNDKYDYSKIVYKDRQTKVEIICKTHGSFWQPPSTHIAGRGCNACAIELRSKKKNMGLDGFIKRAKEIHGDKYDYSKADYVLGKTKIEIVCRIHGSFWQLPESHLCKRGCKKCLDSRGEVEVSLILQRNNIQYEREKVFEDLKRKANLRLDFYLSDFNACIEFQGKQHYIAHSFFGGKEQLKETQTNDQIKREWCADKGMKLIEVPYTTKDIAKFILDQLTQ